MNRYGTGRRHCVICSRWKHPSEFMVSSATFVVSQACMTCRRRTKRMKDRAYYYANHYPLRFPAEPLRALVRRRLEVETKKEIAQQVGVSPDAVRNFLRGRYSTVNLDTVDRWATALGSHIDLLYEER